MRQETRDLVNLQPPRWRLPIWSAAAAAQERGPPGRVAVYCDRLFGRNKLRPSRMESRHLGGVYRMNIVRPP